MVALKVNGRRVEVAAPDHKPLLWVLREDLGVLGPKYGCGVGECGACRVLVDGEAIRSCMHPIGSLGGTALVAAVGGAGYLATIDADGRTISVDGDGAALNAFLTIHGDGRVVVQVPKTEIGQGIHTGLAMVVAEELDIPFDDRIRVEFPVEPLPAYSNRFNILRVRPEEASGPVVWVGRRVLGLAGFIATGASASSAARGLEIAWTPAEADHVSDSTLSAALKAGLRSETPYEHVDMGDVDAAIAANPASLIEATCDVPFVTHACMEPMNATVIIRPDGSAEAWVPSQSPMSVRNGIRSGAGRAGVSVADITCNITMNGGGFGRRSDQDVVAQAAYLAARHRGRPVKLVWPREEDIGRGLFRSHAAARLRAVLGADGLPVAWDALVATQSVIHSVASRNLPFTPGPDGDRLDGVKAQMEGGIVFGVTSALNSRITLENGAVVQSNFHDFPMQRLHNAPDVTVDIMGSDLPPGGAGEPGIVPVAAAIANAVHAATGRRLRSLPLATTETVGDGRTRTVLRPAATRSDHARRIGLRALIHETEHINALRPSPFFAPGWRTRCAWRR